MASGRQALSRPLRILIVDEDRASRDACVRLLESSGHRVTVCRRGDDALRLLEQHSFEIALLDLHVPGVAESELLRAVLARSPETIVIATSAHPTVDSSVTAFQNGAWEYVSKPFSATQLELLIGRAAYALSASHPVDVLPRTEQDDTARHALAVLGSSPAVREVIRLARRVASTDASVFITGESGTGKECMARFIHYQSRRRSGPLVPINCAAIPETLLETELFGHRKGAFTGAIDDKQGLLEAANRGTFVLDELIQMPLSTQAKLLRVLQDGVVRRVGSDSVTGVVNVRFIAITNQSPAEAIRCGLLREDLYYRLRVFPLHLPPLRERREDIPALADHFLRLFWNRHRRGEPLPYFSDRALRALMEHSWRGNIRELQNVIEHGVVMFEPGALIESGDIPFPAPGHEPREMQVPIATFADQSPAADGFYECRKRLLEQFERRYLEDLVARTRGNLSKAARIAGIQRTTLYRLMEKHGLHRQIAVVTDEVTLRSDQAARP